MARTETLLDRVRARTGMRSGYTILDRMTGARKKLGGMGAGGVSKAMLGGQRPLLSTLASIFPSLGSFMGQTSAPAATTETAPAAGSSWGVYDYSGYDPMPQFAPETKRPRRRGI